MARRRTEEAPPPVEVKPGGKGRATPKRREAQAGRRRPLGASVDRKTARDEARRTRMETRLALQRGDESKMPARDRGPVKRFVRDYVDSRRTIAEFFLPIGVLLYIPIIALPGRGISYAATIGLFLLLVVLIGELTFLGLRLRRAVRERFGPDQARGVTMYGVLRAGQLRRWRLPRPQVKLGERPERRR